MLHFSPVKRDEDQKVGYSSLGGVYLHGTLETFFDYDLVNIHTLDVLEFLEGEENGFDGVEVVVEGYPDKVLLYAWKPTGNCPLPHRGVLVDAGDTKSICYAKEKFDKRSGWL